MKKVYLVTDGYYSDFGICAVFSTKERAEKYRNAFYPDGHIGEWDVDKAPKFGYPQNGRFYEVAIQHVSEKGEFRDYVDGQILWTTVVAQLREDETHDTYNEYYVDARDEDHAIKIALDRHYEFKSKKHLAE